MLSVTFFYHTTGCHYAESRYAECRSATKTFGLKSVGRISFCQNIMVTLCWSGPEMLPSIEGTGAKLGEGM